MLLSPGSVPDKPVFTSTLRYASQRRSVGEDNALSVTGSCADPRKKNAGPPSFAACASAPCAQPKHKTTAVAARRIAVCITPPKLQAAHPKPHGLQLNA